MIAVIDRAIETHGCGSATALAGVYVSTDDDTLWSVRAKTFFGALSLGDAGCMYIDDH